MTDRNFVLRWAHLGLGRNPRHRQIIEEQRLSRQMSPTARPSRKQKNAALAARKASSGNSMRLAVATRYAKGIAHRLRSRGVGHDSITSARDEAE